MAKKATVVADVVNTTPTQAVGVVETAKTIPSSVVFVKNLLPNEVVKTKSGVVVKFISNKFITSDEKLIAEIKEIAANHYIFW